MTKDSYKEEFKKVFTSLAVNYPHIYKSVNFDDLASDWYEFFTENRLPPQMVQKSYKEVLRYKAETGNDFGAVSALDMLAGFIRLSMLSSGSKNKIQCELCTDGYVRVFNLYKNKDELQKCTNNH